MSGTSIEDEVEALEALDLEGLRLFWRRRYGAPPKLRSPELLRLMLTWRIQARAFGGLDSDTRRGLRRPTGEKGHVVPSGGTRLTREWQGVRHEVTALGEGGFLYDGERYQSLSQIARLITGARWNGPRFFGLRAEGAG